MTKTDSVTAKQSFAARGIGIVGIKDPRYPTLLAEIPDPPAVLYVYPSTQAGLFRSGKCVAVVGARAATAYGIRVTRTIVGRLVADGITVVSGMATGIDTAVHQTAMEAGGRTIAVLGCGVDIIYPESNAPLYRRLATGKGSAIVSEVPPGRRSQKAVFSARNRIISGLSLAVIVVEGGIRSGTLITARYAAVQGRDVLAVPGPVTSETSRGPNLLISEGAVPVTDPEKVLSDLGMV